MASGLQIEMLDDIDDYSDLSPKEYINAWVKLATERVEAATMLSPQSAANHEPTPHVLGAQQSQRR